MSRQEQIQEAARQRADQYSHPVDWSDTYYGFIDGANWADSHPAWVSVEERLPKHDEEVNGLISYPTVLVCLYDGYRTEDYYDDIRGKWGDYDGEVEYWMPMPEAPTKEGGQEDAS